MRILDRQKIPYEYEEYECEDFTDGIQVADQLGYDRRLVYKTLVTIGKSGQYYVFVIPIEEEIDFKKAAKVVGGEIPGDAALKRADQSNRLCTGRLHGNRNEKAVSHRYQPDGRFPGIYSCQRRPARNTVEIKPGGS